LLRNALTKRPRREILSLGIRTGDVRRFGFLKNLKSKPQNVE